MTQRKRSSRTLTYYPGAVDRPHSVTVGPPGQAATTYYYVQDVAPGNVLGLITAGGQVAASYQYDPWGRITSASESGLGGWSNPLRFGAREYDAETGLYYHRARYYDPTLQRFVSRDPIGLGGGVNWYAYAGNNPVNYRDPSGTCATDLEYSDDDTGMCADGGGGSGTGSLGIGYLPGVTVTGWPFSTPKGVGATPNFLNPNARGGTLCCGAGSPGGVGGPGGGTGTAPASAPAQPQKKTGPFHGPSCSGAALATNVANGALDGSVVGAVYGAFVGAGFGRAGGTTVGSIVGAAAGAAAGAPTIIGEPLAIYAGGLGGGALGAWAGGIVGVHAGAYAGAGFGMTIAALGTGIQCVAGR